MKNKKIITSLFLFANITIFASNQIVNNINDSGAGSLRQAVYDVGIGENVTFSSTLTYLATFILTSGSIILDKSINIIGTDIPTDIVIDGNGNSLIFEQTAAGNNDIIFMSGLVLSNAANSAFLQNENAAGNEFTISNCVFLSNTNRFDGGAIDARGDSINIIINSTFADNRSGDDGGALMNQGYLILKSCTFFNNYLDDDGGAICCDDDFSGSADIINCTFSGNVAADNGSAIYSKPKNSAIVTIYNSTIINNNNAPGCGAVSRVRGILNIYSSILANSSELDLEGNINIVRNCVIESRTGSIAEDVNNFTDDPGLSELADNAGPTLTHKFINPQTTICLDRGTNILSLSYDQRGFPFQREINKIDIGAYEYNQLPFINITNGSFTVSYAAETIRIFGTNNSIVGKMWIKNITSLNRSKVDFDSVGWTSGEIQLDVGENILVVYGTNQLGAVAKDRILVRRWGKGKIKGWGTDAESCISSAPSGTNFALIASGNNFSLALKNDGTLSGWGANDYEQRITPLGNDFVDVKAGAYHALALKRDGSIIAWGRNNVNQTNCPTGNDFIAIAAGNYHNLALKSDGTIVGWGSNNDGQTTCPTDNNFIAIAAGDSHSIALTDDLEIKAWGLNFDNQADNHSETNYIAIAGGGKVTMALKSFGELIGWGEIEFGKLPCPTGTDYKQVSAGFGHGIALKSNNSIKSWGRSASIANDFLYKDFIFVSAGQTHNLALQLPASLFLVITNQNSTVDFSTTNIDISGTNNEEIIGMWWTNSLTQLSESIPLGSPWWTAESISLDFGENVITVFGTNELGNVISDSVTIIRESSLVPFIYITNTSPLIVQASITEQIISGTNINIAGKLAWSNSLVAGETTFDVSGNAFDVNITNLIEGDNFIYVFGTNEFNQSTNDVVCIRQKSLLENLPFINITNETIVVELEKNNCYIGITNANIVGDMCWTNSLVAGEHWIFGSTFNIDNLLIGTNTIFVFGTNHHGVFTNDSIKIIQESVSIYITIDDILTNSWPVIFSGTASNALSIELINESTGQSYPCIGSNNWTVCLTGSNNIAQTYYAKADGAGFSSLSKIILIDHDNIPPTIDLLTPIDNFSNVNENFVFTFNVIDDKHTVTNTEIRFDNNQWQTILSGDDFSFDEGCHTWEIRATDNVGSGNYTNSETRTFFVGADITNEPASSSFLSLWPEYIGYNQNGSIEFMSRESGTWALEAGAAESNLITIASGECVAGWNLVAFNSTNLPDSKIEHSLSLKLNYLSTTEILEAGRLKMMNDLKEYTLDDDFDMISVKYKTKGNGICYAKGRTLFITNGLVSDLLFITAKQIISGFGNRACHIAGIITDGGFKKLKISGSVDLIHADKPIDNIFISGGNLGANNNTKRYNVRFPGTKKTKIIVKNKKIGTVSTGTANIYANILIGKLANNIKAGQLEYDPWSVSELSPIKQLVVSGGNIGIENIPKRINAAYINKVLVKDSTAFAGNVIDYSFFLEQGNMSGFAFKSFTANSFEDSSGGNSNMFFICGYNSVSFMAPAVLNDWKTKNFYCSFGKITSKIGKIEGTIAVKTRKIGTKISGIDSATWIVSDEN